MSLNNEKEYSCQILVKEKLQCLLCSSPGYVEPERVKRVYLSIAVFIEQNIVMAVQRR